MRRRAYIVCLALLCVAGGCRREPDATEATTNRSAKQEPQASAVVDIPVDRLNAGYKLVGKIRQPLGKVVAIQGVIVKGERKGYEGIKKLRIQKVDGVAVQGDSEITLKAYWGEFGEDALPKLVVGSGYEFTGYESGGYVGIPDEAYQRAGRSLQMVQTTRFYFHTEFICLSGKLVQ